MKTKFTVARLLQALYRAKGVPALAASYAAAQGGWADRHIIVDAAKAAAAGNVTGDFGDASAPIAEVFVEAMRGYSVALRLGAMRRVPFRTRVFSNAAGVVAAEVAEGDPIPVLTGSWSATTLTPRAFAGISVASNELMESGTGEAMLALVDDLAKATAEAENLAFVSPLVTGSVLNGATNFASSGSAIASVDADLRDLVDAVPNADKPGAAFLMAKATATFLSLVRGSGGSPAYPAITPQGGSLLGIPVLVTSACEEEGSPPTRVIGLVSGSEILFAGGSVELALSEKAALEMLDDPTNNVTTPTATSHVSLWQAGAVATRAIRRSDWFARANASAYFTAGY